MNMATIHDLPNQVLVQILSYFDISDLLNVEMVCRSWRSAIQESIWNQLMCIHKKIVYYRYRLKHVISSDDHLENVKDICNGLSNIGLNATDDEKKMRDKLKNTVIKLLRKLSSESYLPLDVVEEVLSLEYPRKSSEGFTYVPVSKARAAVAKVAQEVDVSRFKAVRVKDISLDQPQHPRDPFSVAYKNSRFPLPLDRNKITRLCIGSLVLLSSSENELGIAAARTLRSHILNFPQLETIEIERLEFTMPSLSEMHVFNTADVAIVFHPHCCQFSIDEFLSFFTLLGKEKFDKLRNKKIVDLVDEWINKKCIKNCEITSVSKVLCGVMHTIGRQIKTFDNVDVIFSIISRVYPMLTTDLYLVVYNNDCTEELVIRLLQKLGFFSQLKRFTVNFDNAIVDEDDEDDDLYECISEWDVFNGVQRAMKVLRLLCSSIQNLEHLTLDFGMGGEYCLSSMFMPVEVSGPLPHLQRFINDGLICFPFVISVVRQAPNLDYLIISCSLFEDERDGVQWIKKLLDSLETCRNLSSLTISVSDDKQFDEDRAGAVELRGQINNNRKKDQALLESIQNQFNHLLATLPKLRQASVKIESCHFECTLKRK